SSTLPIILVAVDDPVSLGVVERLQSLTKLSNTTSAAERDARLQMRQRKECVTGCTASSNGTGLVSTYKLQLASASRPRPRRQQRAARGHQRRNRPIPTSRYCLHACTMSAHV